MSMDKKVLIVCMGNSCRSIISQAIIDSYLDGVVAHSCGVAPSGEVNENAKRVLISNGIWSDRYRSKHIDEVLDMDFDLVITVCDGAKESCPTFPKSVQTVHIGFDDPNGKEYGAFEQTYRDIKDRLLPKVKEILE